VSKNVTPESSDAPGSPTLFIRDISPIRTAKLPAAETYFGDFSPVLPKGRFFMR
jgi:hypothetical protein